MVVDIYISNRVGRCAVCGFPILDTGYNDEMVHDFLYDILYPGWEENDWFFRTFRQHGAEWFE